MTRELAKLLNLIAEALRYLKPEEEQIVLAEVKMLGLGLDGHDIKNCLKYLSDQDIAQTKIAYGSIETKPTTGVIHASHTSTRTAEYNRLVYIFYIDRERIKPLLSQASRLQTQLGGGSKAKKARLVEKDAQGIFSYDGKKIAMSKETLYYTIFDILFSSPDQSGLVSYEEIIEKLIEQRSHESKSSAAWKKSVSNALSEHQGLFMFARVNGRRLKNQIPDGRPLIELVRGKGVRLNNPPI